MVPTSYELWAEASDEALSFYKENITKWDDAIAATYNKLRTRADRLFIEWRAEVTGLSVSETEARINASIHSARD